MGTSDGHRSVSSLIRTLAAHPGDAVAEAFRIEMRGAYWEAKDLPAALAIGFAAVDRCLVEAARSDGRVALERRGEAKGFLYDISSFAWPGWDEPGIEVDPSQARLGLDAAIANLELAIELDKDALPMTRAHWMLGAHRLTAGSAAEAEASFGTAEEFAERAGSTVDAALARAFGALARLAEGRDHAEDALAAALGDLADLPDGDVYVEQVAAARRVLAR